MISRLQKSASLRLTFLVAILISAVSLLSLGLQYQQVVREFDRRQLEELQSDLDGYSALYEQRRIISLRQAMEFRAAAQTGHDVIFLLLDKQGDFLGGNIPSWPTELDRPAADSNADFSVYPHQFFMFQVSGTEPTNFIGVARNLPGGFPLFVGRSLDQRNQLLFAMRQMILLVGFGMIVLSLGAGWLVSRLVLTRINRVNDLADRVAAGALDARIVGSRSNDEFGRLESHVHRMLDRIEALQKATGQLSDSIAHELRTPLNRIRQKLDGLQGQDALVEDLKSELRSTVRVFDALLDIAVTEAATGSAPGLKPVNLSEVCMQVFELYEPTAEELGLTLSARVEGDLWVLGDASLIAQLLSNLLDNALKFSRSGDSVNVELTDENKTLRLVVKDTGPGVQPAFQASVFDRFSRDNPNPETTGHGLGLALVKAIATRHGVKLCILPVKKGFAVECIWPRNDALPKE